MLTKKSLNLLHTILGSVIMVLSLSLNLFCVFIIMFLLIIPLIIIQVLRFILSQYIRIIFLFCCLEEIIKLILILLVFSFLNTKY